MRELLALRQKFPETYTEYVEENFWLQRGASHRILSLARGFLLMIGFAVFSFPSAASAQAVACVDAVRLPGVQSACTNGTVSFPSIIVDPADANDPMSSFVNVTCPQNQLCAVQTGDALCAGLARTAQLGTYSCVTGTACPTGRTGLSMLLEPAAGACGGGKVCCSAAPAAAPTNAPGRTVTLPDPLGGVSLPEFIGNMIRAFAGIAGAVALLMFVFGGVMWIWFGGVDPARIKDAKSILRHAFIGLILIFGAYFFTSAIIGAILANPE